MHAKAIAESYQRTACNTTPKTMADLVPSDFITGGALVPAVKYAVVQAEATSLRWTTDGSAPTASRGFILAAGERMSLTPAEFVAFQVIEAAGGGYANTQLYSA